MIKNLYLVSIFFIYFCLNVHGQTQTVYVTMSGQRVTKGLDGHWVKLNEEIKTYEDSLGMLQTTLNPLEKPEQEKFQYEDYQLLNVDKVKSMAKENEIRFFGNFLNLRNEVEETEIKISAAKTAKDEGQLKKLEILEREQRKLLKEKEDQYVKYGMLAVETDNLSKVPPKKLDREVEKLAGLLGVSDLRFKNSETSKQSPTAVKADPHAKNNECSVNTIVNGKEKIFVVDQSDWFTFTPDKLKNYFKDRSLLEAGVSFSKSEGQIYLNLEIIVASKDASKNYGNVQKGAVFNVQFINSNSITLYAEKSEDPVVESYTGFVKYKIMFPVPKSDVGILQSVPIDFVGLMWSSGFEKYMIYNVDLAMHQLQCLNKY